MLKRRRKSRRRQRPRVQTFNRLIPNLVTIGALCLGLTGVQFALADKWEYAVIAIVVAAILDALDGTLARLLKAASDFGAELDSLSDVIAFGVAPAFIMYFWSLSEAGGIGWAAALFYATCCALRLARFNSTLESRPPYAAGFFTGVPAPAGALLALLPLNISFEVGGEFLNQPAVVAVWLVVIALLMVSHIPTFSLKQIRVPTRLIVPMLALFGLLVAGLVTVPWLTLSVAAAVYLGSFGLSVRSYFRRKSEAERLAASPKRDDSDDSGESGDKPVQLRQV